MSESHRAGIFSLSLTDNSAALIVSHPASLTKQNAATPLDQIRGDPARQQQALLNHAMNAVKFTESGYVALRARLLENNENEMSVSFEVGDSGIGIPNDTLSAPTERSL